MLMAYTWPDVINIDAVTRSVHVFYQSISVEYISLVLFARHLPSAVLNKSQCKARQFSIIVNIPVNPEDVRILDGVEVGRQDPPRGAGTVPDEEEHVGHHGEPVAGDDVVPQYLVDILEAVHQTDVAERRLHFVLREEGSCETSSSS